MENIIDKIIEKLKVSPCGAIGMNTKNFMQLKHESMSSKTEYNCWAEIGAIMIILDNSLPDNALCFQVHDQDEMIHY